MLHDKGRSRLLLQLLVLPERMQETIDWLQRHNVPFRPDHAFSTGGEVSGVAKQAMLQKLQDDYRMVGTLFDDSVLTTLRVRLCKV